MPKTNVRRVAAMVVGLFFFLFFATARNNAQTPGSDAASLTEAQLQARAALNRGVEAFKKAQFDEAAQQFARAEELDPTLVNARLYLATAYASQYIPGAPTEENERMGRMATDVYRDVLQIDPQNLPAIDGLASILYQRAGQPFSMELSTKRSRATKNTSTSNRRTLNRTIPLVSSIGL